MRRLVFVFLVSLIGWLPSAAHAQDKAPVPSQGAPESYDFGVRPVLEVAAGAVTGVIVASVFSFAAFSQRSKSGRSGWTMQTERISECFVPQYTEHCTGYSPGSVAVNHIML